MSVSCYDKFIAQHTGSARTRDNRRLVAKVIACTPVDLKDPPCLDLINQRRTHSMIVDYYDRCAHINSAGISYAKRTLKSNHVISPGTVASSHLDHNSTLS